MSALRRRANKGGIPERLLASPPPSDSKKASVYAGVPQKEGATWTEVHQWGLVPLLLTLFARAYAAVHKDTSWMRRRVDSRGASRSRRYFRRPAEAATAVTRAFAVRRATLRSAAPSVVQCFCASIGSISRQVRVFALSFARRRRLSSLRCHTAAAVARSPLAGIVFDETHFGRFTNQYTRGQYYFDM